MEARSRPFAPACERNRDPILAVLRTAFADARDVLEIGSGTGQHAVHFAAAMPWLRWQCSDVAGNLGGIRQWLDDASLPNTPPPIELAADAAAGGLRPMPGHPGDEAGGSRGYDAVFSANTLHIMGWPEVEALFNGLDDVLAPSATLVVYGPFNVGGAYTSDSNREFDDWLKVRDPRSAIRDLEAVDALARRIGFVLVDDMPMPANNRCLAWRRGN